MTDIQRALDVYARQMKEGQVQAAYHALLKFLAELKSAFPEQYRTGSISPGYLDYSYFPFSDDILTKN